MTIQPFAIGRYEVTFREWDACAAAGYCRAIPRNGSADDGDQGWGRGWRPVVTVSWNDITGEDVAERGFLAWLNDQMTARGVAARYRLPTEAEWEYAARAGSTTPYAFGVDPEQSCAFMNGSDRSFTRVMSGASGVACSDGYLTTAPVGAYRANAFRLHDMHGNVWEWVQDCWNVSLDATLRNGRARLNGDCSAPVLRGGSWSDPPQYLRSAARLSYSRGYGSDGVGFRVSRTRAD